jgi:hypothetical protein
MNAAKALPSRPQYVVSDAVWLGQKVKHPEVPLHVPPILLTNEYW